jgi:hypothetical protein
MDETEAREIIAELQRKLPLVEEWIDKYLEAHAVQAIPVIELGFSRIPDYFSRERLKTSKAVNVDRVQVPPLRKMGIPYFNDFEEAQFRGITYKDTFFVGREAHNCEATHFHEIVHIIQWDELKPRIFLKVYAVGLLTQGYKDCPLERMAYQFQSAFERSIAIHDLERKIRRSTRLVAKAFGQQQDAGDA